MRKISHEAMIGYGMILPALIYLSLFYFYPIISAVNLSFQEYDISSGKNRFIGLANYFSIMSEDRFFNAIKNTFFFTFSCTSIELAIGMCLALLLNRDLRDKGLFRTLLLTPLMLTPVVYSLQFRWMYADQYGVINNILKGLGIAGPLWIADANIAMYSIMITMIWAATPFVMIVLLAGLQSIPPELYEAAQIDGASIWNTFKNITLPLLKPAILVVLLIRTMDAFKMFDIFYILTGGGPGFATEVLSIYIYKTAFSYLNLGKASALSCIMTLIISMIALVYIQLFRISSSQEYR